MRLKSGTAEGLRLACSTEGIARAPFPSPSNPNVGGLAPSGGQSPDRSRLGPGWGGR